MRDETSSTPRWLNSSRWTTPDQIFDRAKLVSGDEKGKGGIYNFVTKRGHCKAATRRFLDAGRDRSAITWKYPSCILHGDNSVGEFYSVALTNNYQQAIPARRWSISARTRTARLSRRASRRGGPEHVSRPGEIQKGATNSRNFSQCDSLLIGDKCARTRSLTRGEEHLVAGRARSHTSKIGEDQIFIATSRPFDQDAMNMIVNGFCKEVFRELPMEFAVEAQKLWA